MNKSSKNLKLEYDDWGTGEPAMLLLPGWCSDRGILTALAKLLSNNRRVINLDLPGHNESDYPEGDFGSLDIVCEILNTVDALGINQFATVSVAHAG
jgi:pimeloyl-ACP methyl ester carboxylesterase